MSKYSAKQTSANNYIDDKKPRVPYKNKDYQKQRPA